WPRQRPPAGPELGTCTAPTRPRALTRRLHGGLGLIPHPRLDLRRCQVDLTARLRDCAPTSMISHYQCHLPPRGPTLDFLTNHHAHWLLFRNVLPEQEITRSLQPASLGLF